MSQNFDWVSNEEPIRIRICRVWGSLEISNKYEDNSLLQTWITEKMKVVESTDELGNDLAGVMALQRRLAGMEKDLDAIQAKVRLRVVVS